MKKIILLLYIIIAFTTSLKAQTCSGGGCTNRTTQNPASTLSTSSNSWSSIGNMYAGQYAACNVTCGNTYEWSTCGDFGGSNGTNFNPELTIANSNWSTLCYNNNSGRTNCPNSPYISWKANFTGIVYVLITNGWSNSCATTTIGNHTSLLRWRESVSGSCCIQASCTNQSGNINTTTGSNFTIPTTVSGTSPNMQWQISTNGGAFTNLTNNGIYSNVNSNTLNISGVLLSMNNYKYRLLVSNSCNAVGSYSNEVIIFVTNPCPTITFSNSQTNVSGCAGNSNGSITFNSPVGGAVPYQYSINGGSSWSSAQTFNSLTSGSYNLVVKDANGCTSVSNTAFIGQPNPISININSQTNPSTCGGTNGSISVTASGGAGNFKYSLNSGSTQQSGAFNNLVAGVYIINVTDINNCSNSQSITISDPSNISLNITSKTDVLCFGDNSGKIIANATGGAGTLTYTLTPTNQSNTNGVFNGLSGNTYTLKVKDGKNCSKISNPILITQPTSLLNLTTSITPTTTALSNDGVISVIASGGTTPYTYSRNGINFISNSTFANLTAGNYTVYIKDANNCITSKSVIVAPPGPSITIASSVIQSWQREGDPIDGSVSVDLTNVQGNQWHLEIDIYQPNSNKPTDFINYPSTNSTITYFSSNDLQLKTLIENNTIKEGCKITYSAVLGTQAPYLDIYNASIGTTIIEKKWVQKNVVYYNAPNESIDLPLKNVAGMQKIRVVFKHDYNTSICMCGNANAVNDLKLNSATYHYYKIDVDGNYELFFSEIAVSTELSNINYINKISLKNSNSSISTVDAMPAVYNYALDYLNSSNVIIEHEEGKFDLTKYGNINKNIVNTKVLVFIGGLNNTIEKDINNVNNEGDLSNQPWSITKRAEWDINGYSTWYIGQPNNNYTQLNAYDIGLALDSIKAKTKASEIKIIAHSKAGLEVRTLLQGLALPYTKFNSGYSNYIKDYLSSKYSFEYPQKNILNITKVVFLATPHTGSPEHAKDYVKTINNNTPAINELAKAANYQFIDFLNNSSNSTLPDNVQFANLTVYHTSNLLLGYEFEFDDGAVKGFRSDILSDIKFSLFNSFNKTTNVLQLYQHNSNQTNFANAASWPHTQIHRNSCITDIEPIKLQKVDHTGVDKSNLNIIVQFLDGIHFESCPRPQSSPYSSILLGSILSNASVYRKEKNEIDYNLLGFTDEKGNINKSVFPAFQIGDTLMFKAQGYETTVVPYSNNIKSSLALFRSSIPSPNVLYPTLSLVNQNPVTNDSTIQIKVQAKNTTKYLINENNSDTSFTQLALSNNISIVKLITGLNNIIVKFIGVDTVTISKQVYYLPDSLMSDYSTNLTINTTNNFVGSKMFVNNVFYEDINTTINKTKLLKGLNEVKFSKFGYRDTLYNVEGDSIINLVMSPYSYSSNTDSSIIDFKNNLSPQYWENITVKNTTLISDVQVSMKQYEDSFNHTGLVPVSRKFVFRNLGNSIKASLRTVIALDQINTPDTTSVYLMNIRDGVYIKRRANQINLSEYDPEVQKLAFDSLNILKDKTEEIVLMQKLAPIIKTPTLKLFSGQDAVFPLRSFISDPDSLKDLSTVAINIQNIIPEISVSIKDTLVYISSIRGYTGTLQIELSATHDYIFLSKTMELQIVPPPLIPDQLYIYPNPAHENMTIEFILMADYANTTLSISNIMGRLVRQILPGIPLKKGYHYYNVPVSNFSAGVYIINLNDKQIKQFIKY
ncbi:MAG: hypothetical protein NTZ19_00895 [Bacteroidetes bacterium]|nr:hypothetical protein [Bacteroidota bacterium]